MSDKSSHKSSSGDVVVSPPLIFAHADALMLVERDVNKPRLIVRVQDGHTRHASYFWMTRHRKFIPFSARDLDGTRHVMIQSAWIRRTHKSTSILSSQRSSESTSLSEWTIIEEYSCDRKAHSPCRIGDTVYSYCGLHLADPSIAFDPEQWGVFSYETLCDRARTLRLRQQIVPALATHYLRNKRETYRFIDSTDFPEKIKLDDLYRVCQAKINLAYLKKQFNSPFNQTLLAVRHIRPCGGTTCYRNVRSKTCVVPTPRLVYDRMNLRQDGVAYKTFSATFKGMSPQDKKRELCRLVQDHPLNNPSLIGGFCISTESPTTITILVLCSHRSMGGRFLRYFIDRFPGKQIIINHPLPAVVDFYKKFGFEWIDPQNMIYTKP